MFLQYCLARVEGAQRGEAPLGDAVPGEGAVSVAH